MATLMTAAVTAADPALADDLAAVGERLRRSTVHVAAGWGSAGSGIVWTADGVIVTNAHVAPAARAAVTLADGRVLPADVTQRDERRDLAALAVDAAELPAAPLGDSDALRAGELVIAVGNPMGVVGALALGVVHAASAPRGRGWVVADVRLAPGNSGGPLADARGRVVGVNSMIANGLALAVPSAAVERFLRRDSDRARLGVMVRPVVVGSRTSPALGLLVLDVASGSSAEAAGLLPGDVLLGVDGRPFRAPHDLVAALDDAGAVRLDLTRGGVRSWCVVTPPAPQAAAA